MIERLAEDHANARRLAEGLTTLAGVVAAGDLAQPGTGPLDPDRVTTNFVIFRVERDRAAVLDHLRARNVLMVEYPHGQIRAVTHHGISASDVDATVAAMAEVLAATAHRPLDPSPATRGPAR
jgi:threonine aldolase